MTNRVKGILNDEFVIDCYGNVGVYNHYFDNEIGTLQGWYGSQSKEIRKESEEAYKIARSFLENFIIDTRNMLAKIKPEDVVKIEDGEWDPVTPFPTGEKYPCFHFAVEITDEKYAKYFEEYKGKKYLILMTEAYFDCKPNTFFYEHTCDEYSVKTFLDWQEGLVELRCLPDGRYNRKGNAEDDAVLNEMYEKDRKIFDKYEEEIDVLKKQIEELENKRHAEITASKNEIIKRLPQAKPEFDFKGYKETSEMLSKIGKKLCEEMFK